MSWICKCGLRNSGLNKKCAAALTYRDIEHYQISINTLDELRIFVSGANEMTDKEELFAKYYNRGKILVKDMTDEDLRSHRHTLWEIATEAKATLLAADDEVKERDSKRKVKDKEWLTTIDHDKASSDALNEPKVRAARMSKMDKMREDLRKIKGMDEKIIDEMVKNMQRGATEQNLKTITFNKPSTEVAVVKVKVKPKSDGTPFDVTKLKFGS